MLQVKESSDVSDHSKMWPSASIMLLATEAEEDQLILL